MYVDCTFVNGEDDLNEFIEEVIDEIKRSKESVLEDAYVEVDVVCDITGEGEYRNFDFKVYLDEEDEEGFELLCDEVEDRLEAEINKRLPSI